MSPEGSKPDFLPPPIASPHGGASSLTSPPLPEGFGPHVVVRCTARSALLYGCVEIGQPLGLIIIFFLLFLVGLLLPSVLLSAAVLGIIVVSGAIDYLCARRYIVELQPDGVCRHRRTNTIRLRWHQFLWIVDMGGNIWMATFATGCFISRASFASRSQSREFVRLVRELRRTQGAAWPALFGDTAFQEAPRDLGTSE